MIPSRKYVFFRYPFFLLLRATVRLFLLFGAFRGLRALVVLLRDRFFLRFFFLEPFAMKETRLPPLVTKDTLLPFAISVPGPVALDGSALLPCSSGTQLLYIGKNDRDNSGVGHDELLQGRELIQHRAH